MKIRESGMPDQGVWEGFFTPEAVLRALGLTRAAGDVVDFGCGYGTFTLPAARITPGTVHALDVEPAMVERTLARARAAGLTNVVGRVRDFVEHGTGLPDGSAGYAMLFNILHFERPEVLLREAFRVLAPGGRLGILHWNPDPSTPRGPPMEIRPRPKECAAWAQDAGFRMLPPGIVDLPPYHYGMALERPADGEIAPQAEEEARYIPEG